MEIQTATYQGHDAEIIEETIRLNFGRKAQMSYIHLLDDAHILNFGGMWGGCEQSRGWVYTDELHNRRVETIDVELGDPADDELTDEVIFDRTEYRQKADTYALGMGA